MNSMFGDSYYYDWTERHPNPEAYRRPYADWLNSQEVGMNHVNPMIDDGKDLPYVVSKSIPHDRYRIDLESVIQPCLTVIERMREMEIKFAPWSSARYMYDNETFLAFYFTDQKDAALFMMLWGETSHD